MQNSKMSSMQRILAVNRIADRLSKLKIVFKTLMLRSRLEPKRKTKGKD
jgi:hypothetical protein